MPDLEAGIDDLRARLGAAPVHGGRHAGLGTWNAVLPLAVASAAGSRAAYLELIAIDPRAAAGPRRHPFGLDGLRAPRLVTWALRTDAIRQAVDGARARGFDPGAVVVVERDAPGGARLRWQLSVRSRDADEALVPFLIDWGDAPHPSAAAPLACRLEHFSGEHPEPERVAGMLAALGASLPLEQAAVARLRATIAGPLGRIVLDGEPDSG